MKNTDKYLLHCSGIYTMLAWIEKENESGINNQINNQTIFLSQLGSRYFALGTSNHKKANNPYLAIQSNEAQWFGMIQWDYMVCRKNDHYLYLISSVVQGDEENYPDIPPFAIGIHFDLLDKLELIKDYSQIDGREYFIDTNHEIHVNYHETLFSLNLKQLEEYQNYFNNSQYTDYHQILNKKYDSLQEKFGDKIVPFEGEISNTEEGQKIMKKLNKIKDLTKIYNKWYKKL